MNTVLYKKLLFFCSLLTSIALALALAGCSGGNGTTASGGDGTTASGGTVASYAVGGSISGLAGSVVLQNNGRDNLTVAANGAFSFATKVTNGSTYRVTVLTQPTGQTCSVSTGTGTVSGADISNVTVVCATTAYSVGGTVSGLAGSVVLQDNSGDDLTVAANGAFTFATKVANGSPYSVTVLTQPTGQTCSVSTGTGLISGNNVNNVAVVCATNTYSVGGTVSGLAGSVVLQDNNGDNLTVASNGAFTFATKIANGSPYSVTVLTQPPGQSCSIANGTGTIALANVVNVAITCAVNTYTVGGSVTGLSGSVVLQDNGGDNLTVATNGPFAFPTALLTSSPYNVTVLTQPIGQTCLIANGAGSIAAASATNVSVTCAAPPAAPMVMPVLSGANQATVSWSPVAGAASYNIYWGTSSGITTASTKIASASSPYVQTGLTAGNSYYYRVSAVSAYGETLSDETFTFIYAAGTPAGSFSATTGPMTNGRSGHTATLLPNGKVLVTGGYSGGLVYTASADLYDPATSLFSATTGLMRATRYGHTATLLRNGKVLIAGGWDGTAHVASAELYDPATGLFATTGSMTTRRSFHSATLLPDGKVLISGGYGTTVANAELYDPATGKFSATGSMMVTGRRNHAATLLPDGKVLIAGGASPGAIAISSAELYDPATGLFSAIGSMTAARNSPSSTLLPNGNVLIVGGLDSSSAAIVSAELYNPVTGLFSATTGPMTAARYAHAATLLPNGKVLISGGVIGTTTLASAEMYDPATDIFGATASAVTAARSSHTSTLLPNGKVLITGGSGGLAGGVSYTSAELFQ